MSIFGGIVRGALTQGLSDINAANEFYGDIVKNASLNLGTSLQNVNNAWPEDIKQGEDKYNRYLAIVELLGKDKADYIFEMTGYLDSKNWMALSKQADFGVDFKWNARTEPIETMNKNINRNRTNIEKQLIDSSSIRGMNKVTNIMLPRVPEEHKLERAEILGIGEDRVSIPEEERQKMAKQVVLPTEIVSEATRNATYMALITNAGGVDEASQIYGIDKATLATAQAAMTTIDPFIKSAMQMVDTSAIDILRYQGKDVTDAMIDIGNQINTWAQILRTVSVGGAQPINWEAITDDTIINIPGRVPMTYKEVVEKLKAEFGDKATKENIIELLKKQKATISL